MPISIQEPQTSLDQSPKKQNRVTAIGIDLGTTHTLAAIFDGEKAQLIPLLPESEAHDGGHTSRFLMPSLVGFQDKRFVAGFDAFRLQQRNPASVVHAFKRLLGLSFKEAKTSLYPFALAPCQKEGLKLCFEGKKKSPQALQTLLLETLKKHCEKSLGYPVSDAVITVPAYFDERARNATRTAAKKAGFNVLRLVSEPTAAALAYALDEDKEGLYGVYDLGGGTFDFSLLSMQKGVFNVLATCGHTHLGGHDIDHALLSVACKNVSLCDTEKQALTLKIKAAKEKLSTKESVTIRQGAQNSFCLKRNILQKCADPLITQTLNLAEHALGDANTQKNSLKGIILVGGATRTFGLKERIATFFGKKPICTLNPDHVVALGAARQAYALSEGGKHLLLDITPLTLGIETMGKIVEPIIRRNTRIPVVATQTFTTAKDNQKKLHIHVVQGEHKKVDQCRSLAHFELENLPPLKAGKARIKVSFVLDSDGILTVTAQEKTSGCKQKISVKPSYDLTLETAKKLLSAS